MIRLVKPSVKYKKSFLAEEETVNSGNFPEFLKRIRDYDKGKNLPKGHVQSSNYWLVNGREIIGEITIRHRLNARLRKKGGHIGYGIWKKFRRKGYGKKILKLALQKAKQFGIKKALVTCDEDNIGSWKIIEANGGVLQNKIKYDGTMLRRYWIAIKK